MKKANNHIDGWLYVGVAVCAALTASLGSDEAAKYFTPEYLFKLKTVCGAVGAGLLAGKMYRSTTFAQATSVAATVADGPAPTAAPKNLTGQAVPSPAASNLPAMPK